VKRILITGGAGFIGSNAVVHYARQNWEVIVLDNLSRKGSSENLEWIRNQVAFCFEQVDIRDSGGVVRVSQNCRMFCFTLQRRYGHHFGRWPSRRPR
jgi:CDP-paratose 2-epimerase